MRYLLPVLANLLLLFAMLGVGGLLRPLLPKSFLKIDRLSIIALGGLGLLGVLLFLLGLARYSPATILILFLPAGALGVTCLLQEVRGVNFRSILHNIPLIPAFVIAVVLSITTLGGLAEPVGNINLDTILYHYLGPRVWLFDGAIRPVLDSGLTAFPATVEVQYGALMAIGGKCAPELFSVISLCLILLITASTALRMGLDRTGTWWVAALLSAMPAVYRGFYNGMIDVIYAAFVIAAARIAFDIERRSHAVLIGLFCGFAMGTKYTGLVSTALIVITIALFLSSFRGFFSRSFFWPVGTIVAVASLVAAPWYVRNWVVLGCPIYPPPPLVYRFFPIRYFPLQSVSRLHMLMAAAGRGMGRGFLSLLLLPFHLTFHPANFESGAGGIGLVPLAFLPFCFRAYPWNQFAKMSAVFGILQTVFWFFTMQESRYLIQVYVVAAIFGVAGWRYVVRAAPRFGPLLSALTIAVSISYGLFMIGAARTDDIHAAISARFAEARKQAKIPYSQSFCYLNRDSSVGKVLILDPSVPPYFLDKSYLKVLGKYGEEPLLGVYRPKEVLTKLSELHITHILDVQSEQSGFQVPEDSKNLFLVFERKDQRIYRVQPPEQQSGGLIQSRTSK